MTINSLKARLVVIMSVIFLVAWLVSTGLAVYSNRDTNLKVSDAILQADAELMASFVKQMGRQRDRDTATEPTSWQVKTFMAHQSGAGQSFQSSDGRSFQVWYEGRLLLNTAGTLHLTPPEQEGFRYSKSPSGGKVDLSWRIYTARDPEDGFWVVAAHSLSIIEDLAWFLLLDHLWPMILVIPLVAAIVFWGVSLGLKPLRVAANTLASRSSDDLQQVNLERIPSEVFPLIEAINDMLRRQKVALDRIDHALANEKRFTANAAHELLTPLAAIKTEAQLQALQAGDQSEAVDEICRRVDRATHTVEQLVTLARLEPELTSDHAHLAELNLATLLQNHAAQYGDEIDTKSIDFDLQTDPDLNVIGVEVALSVLIRNLLDNAVRYTPLGGKIQIHAQRDINGVNLSVANSGRRLPDYLKDHIFDRFVRGPDEVETGSGLGLSIVRRAAEIHGADLSVGVPQWGEGVQFNLRFPTCQGPE